MWRPYREAMSFLLPCNSGYYTVDISSHVSQAKTFLVRLAKRGIFDAIIGIGVLIKGSTMHFEYIADAVSHALMRVQLDTGVPVIFGVLTCLNDDQALDRAGLGRGANGKGHSESGSSRY
jgi:6,7-dimethyl-8-ribityllumazine synthase